MGSFRPLLLRLGLSIVVVVVTAVVVGEIGGLTTAIVAEVWIVVAIESGLSAVSVVDVTAGIDLRATAIAVRCCCWSRW